MSADAPALTGKQLAVADAMIAAVQQRKRITVYTGAGGTGKTVVAAHVCKRLGEAGFNPVPCTMVGKAAARLQAKLTAAGLPYPVRTLSSLVERVFVADDGPKFTAKTADLPPKSVLFIDELSMVGERYFRTRLLPGTRGVPILGCGDYFQIPPVMDRSTGLLEATPHRLTKVHRQAESSPILQLASAMRKDEVCFYTPDDPGEEQTPLREFGRSHGLNVVPAVAWLPAVLASYPIDRIPDAPVLAFTNAEVDRINAGVRQRYRLTSPLPAAGEIIRVLRNNPDAGVYNGEHYRVLSVLTTSPADPAVEVALEGVADPIWVPLDPASDRWRAEPRAVMWGWGYATTVHRSQGSEWPHVRLLIGRRAAALSRSEQGRRLLYTGITRASQQLDVFVVDYDYARKVAKLNNRIRTRVRARERRKADALLTPGSTSAKPRKRKSTTHKAPPGLDLEDLL